MFSSPVDRTVRLPLAKDKYNEVVLGHPSQDPLHPLWNEAADEDSGIFGLPFSIEESAIVLLPVPWDATCSKGTGTACAPELILQASRYVELHDLTLGNIYERGIAMSRSDADIRRLAERAQPLNPTDNGSRKMLDSLADQCQRTVQTAVARQLADGRSVGLVGGDHSISFGSIAAHHQQYPDMGVLQIDAHADLRPSLDGLTRSHASVMYQVIEELEPTSLTQVGIRAMCSVECEYLASHPAIHQFTDFNMQAQLAGGQSWLTICGQILDTLPNDVYLTVDIDGLDPSCCPHTGTPVPGGLTFGQLQILLRQVVASGRKIRGFDLVEVGGHADDALIAAHLLYFLCGLVEVNR